MDNEDLKEQEAMTLNGLRNVASMKERVDDILAELEVINIHLQLNQTEDLASHVHARIENFKEELETLCKTESIFIRKLNKIYKIKDR